MVILLNHESLSNTLIRLGLVTINKKSPIKKGYVRKRRGVTGN